MVDESRYVVYFDHPSAPGMHSVRHLAQADTARSTHVAAHKNVNAVRVAIPPTHYKAPFQQELPVVEVWVHNSVPKP